MKNLVIIPTYNELDNIRPMIDKVFSLSEKFDLLVIDDGSPDGTASVVKEKQQEYPGQLHLIERQGKLGLGTAYLTGFQWALEHGYDYIFEMDCDFSHNPDDLVRLLNAAQEGADLVIGSRYITGVNVVNWPMKRVLLSYYASAYVRLVTGMPVRDATAGFVCYSSNLLRSIDLDKIKMKGYGFRGRNEIYGVETEVQSHGGADHLHRAHLRRIQNEQRHLPRSTFRRPGTAFPQNHPADKRIKPHA